MKNIEHKIIKYVMISKGVIYNRDYLSLYIQFYKLNLDSYQQELLLVTSVRDNLKL